jgi:hypothetical protein
MTRAIAKEDFLVLLMLEGFLDAQSAKMLNAENIPT